MSVVPSGKDLRRRITGLQTAGRSLTSHAAPVGLDNNIGKNLRRNKFAIALVIFELPEPSTLCAAELVGVMKVGDNVLTAAIFL